MKKRIAIFLTVVLAFTLAGCMRDNTQTTPVVPTTPIVPTITAGPALPGIMPTGNVDPFASPLITPNIPATR